MSDDENSIVNIDSDDEEEETYIENKKPNLNIIKNGKLGINIIPKVRIDDPEEEEEDEEEDEEDDFAEDLDDYDNVDIAEDNDLEDNELDEEDTQKGGVSKKNDKKLENMEENQNILSDNDEDDDDEEDEHYLQKFDTDINNNYILNFHPECSIHNYDEISILTNVVKNNDGIIIDDLHKTIPFLTKYEKARILGQRAKQINMGSKPFVKIPENIIDGYLIAELELKQKRIPFIIRRPLAGGGSEYWNVKDLEIISF